MKSEAERLAIQWGLPEPANHVDIDSLAKVLGVSSKQTRNLMGKQPEKFLAANDGG